MEMYPGNAEPEPIDEELCVCTRLTPYLRSAGQPNMGQLWKLPILIHSASWEIPRKINVLNYDYNAL